MVIDTESLQPDWSKAFGSAEIDLCQCPVTNEVNELHNIYHG